MDTDRRERAKSIRAARDWLTGAEHALAGEDDLAGDLKLMLARAELARIAADRRTRIRRWALCLLPPLAMGALLVWLLWDVPPEENPAVLPQEARSVKRVEEVAPVPETPPQAGLMEALPPVAAQNDTAAPAVPPVQEPQVEMAAASAAERAEAASHTQYPRMPDPDLQHLMQVGGKILRE